MTRTNVEKAERAVEAKKENEAMATRRKSHNPEFIRRQIAKHMDIEDFDAVVEMGKLGVQALKDGRQKFALDCLKEVAPYTHQKLKAVEITVEDPRPFNFIMQLDAKPKERKVIDVKPTEARIEIG